MKTFDFNKVPQKGPFSLPVIGEGLTLEKLKTILDSWTPEAYEDFEAKGYGHFLKKAKEEPTPPAPKEEKK